MNKPNKYDIFISYRRDGGAQYARILQLELEKRGYRVFLDYDELTDGIFGDNIKEAIRVAPVFMMVLSAHYLDRCKNEGDWVREELLLAIKQGKHFIPVNPDDSFDGIPKDIPEEIKQVVSSHQYSEVNFGQLLAPSINKLVNDRLSQHIQKDTPSKKRFWPLAVAAALVVAIAAGVMLFFSHQKAQKMASLKMETALDGTYYLNWNEDITLEQLQAIHHILGNMEPVEGGTFLMGAAPNADGEYDEDVDVELETPQSEQHVASLWMGKYEVSVGEWCRVMGEPYNEEESDLPQRNVSFEDCAAFCERLAELSGLSFRLPTEAEWEYVARGGNDPDSTKYAGRENPDEVAWYSKNAKGGPRPCDATNSPMRPNSLDIYDMSGNVSEWCDTPFRPYAPDIPVIDETAKVIRGGNYDSEPYALTVYHREPMNPLEKGPSVGMRLVIGE